MRHFPSLAAGLALLGAVPLAAQDNTSKFLYVTHYQVKPPSTADFADFLKNRWVPAMKKGGAAVRIYSSAPAGGNSGQFIITRPLDSFAMFDGKTTLSKGAGDAAAAAMLAQRAQMIDERVEVVLRRAEDLSLYAEMPKESPLLMVQTMTVMPGQRATFEALWKKDVLPAVKKAGLTVSAWRVTLGGELEYRFASPLGSMAELDKGISLAQRVLDAKAYPAFNDAVGAMTLRVSRHILRLRKDLMGGE